jgi:hypothetical protein
VARDIREAWQELQARADNAGLAAGFTGTVTAFLSDSGPGAGLVGAVLGLTVGVLLLLMWARDARLALGPIGWVPTEEDLMAAFRTLRRKEAFTRLAWALSYPLLFGLGAVVIWAAAT